MALRRSGEVRSRRGGTSGADDLGGERRLGRAAQHPDAKALGGRAPGPARQSTVQRLLGPTAPGAKATTGRPSSGSPSLGAPFRGLLRRHVKFGLRPFRRKRCALRQRQRAAAVDHAGQFLFAEADVVEQAEAGLAGRSRFARESRRATAPAPISRSAASPARCRSVRRPAGRPAPDAGAGPVACAAGPRRCPCARPACNRAAARTASWSGRRPAGWGSAPCSSLTTEWQRTKSPIHM